MTTNSNRGAIKLERTQEPEIFSQIRRLAGVETLKRYLLWLIACIVIYLIWFLNYSIAPVLVLLLVAAFNHERERVKHNQHLAARKLTIEKEKTYIKASIQPEHIPSWVLFPDKVR